MIRTVLAAGLALALVSTAAAAPRHAQTQPTLLEKLKNYLNPEKPVRFATRHGVQHIKRSTGDIALAGRPAECRGIPWCGCWLRLKYGIADVRLNVARAWARVGTALTGPESGAIAVWRHHVGEITAVLGPGRIILKSGNDGGAVRERERSTQGVIAYRKIP